MTLDDNTPTAETDTSAAAEMGDTQTQNDGATEQASASGTNLPPFMHMLFDSLVAAEDAAAEDAEAEEIVQDATDFYAVAQTLTGMSTNAESFADSLELNGMGDIAKHVRAAAKAVRKGAKVSRANAAESLTVLSSDTE
ncbi:hypothetical protein [Sphingomonas sp. ACRSK]|uniref:hypothetical protein n=1 Tax=Sphingomonas sp. ACRSK TaxID=2918213 RepID=UPI001EF73A26|nr:hypothetical protein [Sphingomonas sp. ACRSK]MCG7348898.1 hypothetical protein [Sphingomonas sp. ACRSK]